MPVDVDGGSRHDVAHRVVGQVIAVDERPAYCVHELLPSRAKERKRHRAGRIRVHKQLC